LLTEGNGVPLAVVVAGANRNDFKLARETLDGIVIPRPRATRLSPQGLCLDKGYDYDEVRELVAEFHFTAHIRCRGEEASLIKRAAHYRAHRWVVERSHSWMNRFRRILVRWEKRADTYVAMLHLACALITWKSCGLLG
jgi:putative transposase